MKYFPIFLNLKYNKYRLRVIDDYVSRKQSFVNSILTIKFMTRMLF